MSIQIELRAGHCGFELGLGLLGFGVELHSLGVDAGLQRFELQFFQLQQRCLPLAVGGQRLNAQRLASRLACGMQVDGEGDGGCGLRLLLLSRVDGDRRRQCLGLQYAFQRRGFQVAEQVGGVELRDLQLAVKHLAHGHVAACQLDLAFANIDLTVIHPPLATVEEDLGLQLLQRQALLVPGAGQGVGECGAQHPDLLGVAKGLRWLSNGCG